MAAVAITVLWLSQIRYVENAEHWTADWRTALFSTRKPSQHDSVALVLITEETLEDLPVRIPIDRTMMAKLIRTVASAHPAAIGIDFVFARPTTPAADAELLAAIRDADVPVVLGSADERMGLTEKQLKYHRAFLTETQGRPSGHIFFERKTDVYGISDRVIREMSVGSGSDDDRSFAEVLAKIKRPDAKPRTARIAWLLPPRDGSETFYEVEANDLLGPPEDANRFWKGSKTRSSSSVRISPISIGT
jgi:CHASE2 domain-containing sensor protein